MKNIWTGTALVAIAILAVATPNYGMQAEEERGGAAPAQVQETEKDRKRIEGKVRELMKLIGAAEMGKQMMAQSMTAFKNLPGLPEGFAEKFLELANPEELVNMVVPIYVEHVREDDLDAVIKFFRTDVGQRWVKAQPKIAAESMRVGQNWGRKLGKEVAESLAND